MNYRYKTDHLVIKFPEGYAEEDRLKCKRYCCTPELRLASETETEEWKNDITGVFIKRSQPGDLVEFKIEKCDVGDLTPLLGDVVDFPQDDLAIGFIFKWKEYLAAYGPGRYKITVEFTISGVTGGFDWGQYDLKPYSIENASGTVRVYSEWKTKYQDLDVDFSNSNFKDSIRFNGFFGNREPRTEINNLITKGRKVEKVTRENLNFYTLRTDPVPECITRQLIDLHLLNEDTLLISDHNASNHSYQYYNRPVVLEETAEVEYIERNRWAKVTVKLGDRQKTKKTYYNEEI